jgi:nucleotide-binding universal stress UspA family protein
MAPRETQLERPEAAEEDDTSAANPFTRMLVPVDFSSASRRAFALAMRIAERWGSDVVLFHAAGSDGNDEFLDNTGRSWGVSDVVSQSFDHLKDFAESVVRGSSARHVIVDAERSDDPVEAVARACVRHTPSVIILGAHAHERRRWRRSRAERIARTVSCPVFLVRGEREAYMDADS